MTPDSSPSTPEESTGKLNTRVEPGGPDQQAFTNYGEVFIWFEEDFRGGRKQFQTEETFRKNQKHTCRQAGGCKDRKADRSVRGRQMCLTQQEVQQLKTSSLSSPDGRHVCP